MRKMLTPLVLAAATLSLAATSAVAQDRASRYESTRDDRDAALDYANREGCILPQVVAPSFNNSAASIEMSRIATVRVRQAANRHGDSMRPVCGSEHDPRTLGDEKTLGAPQDPYEEEGVYDDSVPAEAGDVDGDGAVED